MLSKKHYEAIARIVREAKPYQDDTCGYMCDFQTTALTRWGTARDLADYFAADNPRFDRARFLKACGLEG